MFLLYKGNYYGRIKEVVKLIDLESDRSICELCFGDLYIANFCKKNKIKWIGYEINANFVKNAKKRNFSAIQYDVRKISWTEKYDTIIIMGSLYHFFDIAPQFIKGLLNQTDKLIISEPIENLSARKGIIGAIAKRLTNVGNGHESKRYNLATFTKLMSDLELPYEEISIGRDILIIIKK